MYTIGYIVIPVEIDLDGTLKDLEAEAKKLCEYYDKCTPPGFVNEDTGEYNPGSDGPITGINDAYFKYRVRP